MGHWWNAVRDEWNIVGLGMFYDNGNCVVILIGECFGFELQL